MCKIDNIRKEFFAMDYEFKNIRGHIEVFLHGVFQFSADTMAEAIEEIENL